MFIRPELDSLTLIMPRGAPAELRFDGPKVSDPDNDPVNITHTFRKPGNNRETTPGEMPLEHRTAEFNELLHPQEWIYPFSQRLTGPGPERRY